MLLLAIMAGFLGGAVASRVFTLEPALAQKKPGAIDVIEAQEFRLVNKEGKTEARLTMRNGRLFAEIPDLTKWTIQFLGE
jgi:hypothetical protein